MATAAKSALRPLLDEYQHQQRMQDAMGFIFLSNGNYEDQEDARNAVREALAAVALGVNKRQIEQAKQTALAPVRDRIATRLRAEERQEKERHLIKVALQEVYEHAKLD